MLIRLFDVLFALLGLALGMPILLLLWLLGLWDTGSPLFRQQRVGRHQRPFVLVKFRTMRPGTAAVATHLADVAAVTSFGRFLRRTKLDELPQLWNVLKGEMSLVGPRPCLLNQQELIEERSARRVFDVRPGITGLAQVQGIDMSTPARLAEIDAQMLKELTRRRRNEILNQVRSARVAVRTLPSMSDLAQGKVSVSDLRELDIDDLLGREPVAPNHILLAKNIVGSLFNSALWSARESHFFTLMGALLASSAWASRRTRRQNS